VTAPAPRNVVTVSIAGDEYAIRTEASPEYTRECAAFVDGMLREIQGGGLLHAHKAPVLVALAIADRYFQARKEAESIGRDLAGAADRLSARIEAEISASSLATPA
jgi:cell division protein ZapA (FtsZ GTPase activity inhibitor)